MVADSPGAPPPFPGIPEESLQPTIAQGPTDAPVTASQRLGRFYLFEELGRGGMGVVFRAFDPTLRREVALKVREAGGDDVVAQRFLREARTAARLRHPAIVQVHEVGESERRQYIAMDFIRGSTLRGRLRQGKPDLRAGVKLVLQVVEALAHAHAHGIVHRDVKPENILLDGDSRPYVADFGLAREVSEAGHLTVSGVVLGTPAYMSPEQANGEEAGPAADVYALGAVLYEVLVGHPPFDGASVIAVLSQVLEAEPVRPRRRNPAVPADLEAVCLKCLEKDPRRRYAVAGDLADELRRFLAGEPVLTSPPSRLHRLEKRLRRHPRVAGLAAAACLALGVGIVVAARERAERKAAEQRLARERELGDLLGRVHAALGVVEAWGRNPADLTTGEEGRAVKLQEAADLAAAAEALAPGHLEVRLVWAHVAVLRGEPEEGLRRLEQVRAEGGETFPLFHYLLGWASFRSLEHLGSVLPVLQIQTSGRALTGQTAVRMIPPRPLAAAEKERVGVVQSAFAKWLESAGNDLRAWRAQIASAYIDGRYRETISLYQRAIRLDGAVECDAECRALVARAWLLHGLRPDGRTDADALTRAREHLDWLEPRSRRSPALWMWRARVDLARGEAEAALAASDRALACRPPKPAEEEAFRAGVLIALGRQARYRGEDPAPRYAAAAAGLNRAREIDPAYLTACSNLGLLYQVWAEDEASRNRDPSEKFGLAGEVLQQAMAGAPANPDFHVQQAALCQRLASWRRRAGGDAEPDLRRGIEAAEAALARDGKHVLGLLQRAALRLDLGRLLEDRGRDPEAEYRSAVDGCEQALRLQPANGTGVYNRALALVKLGRWEEKAGKDPSAEYRAAMVGFAEATRANPGNLDAWLEGARAAFFLGCRQRNAGAAADEAFAQAAAGYGRVLASRPDLWEAHFETGLVHDLCGRTEEAVRSYETAARLRPGEPRIEEAQRRLRAAPAPGK